MSPRHVRAHRAARERGDDGFTLIELMVAITLLGLVMAAVLPVIVAGVRGGVSAKYSTQAKSLGQERLERMRNLPYHVDAGIPVNVPPYSNIVDVLDTYYRNSTSSTSGTTLATVTEGWVCAACARLATSTTAATPPSGGDITPALEPSRGAFYRKTFTFTGVDQDPSLAKFTQLVDTQFVDATGAPVNPAAGGYDNVAPGAGRTDSPASNLVAVTVLTGWSEFGRQKVNVLSSRITESSPAVPTITAQARSSVVKVSSTLDANTLMSVEAGVISADGSVATGATAGVQGQGVSAGMTPGARADGTIQTVTAPPDSAVPVAAPPPVGAGTLDGTCTAASRACFYQSTVSDLSARVAEGLPKVASGSSPATAILTRANSGTSVGRGFIFNNAPSPPAKLGLLNPLVTMDTSSGGLDLATATAYLDTTQGTGHMVVAAAGGSMSTLELFPTSWTPANRGVIEIVLTSAALRCTSSAATPTASASYAAIVRYYSSISSSYVTLTTITNGQSSDPLAIPLATTLVRNDPTYGPIYLGDYIASWSSASAARMTSDPDGNGIRAELPSIVTVSTQPTRTGDATSAITAQVGRLSCYAADERP